MNLEEAQSQLTMALSPHREVPLFELLSESQWHGKCSVSKTAHRDIKPNEGGVVCLDCYKVVIRDTALPGSGPDTIKLWANILAGYWGNRKAVIKPN